MAQVKSEDWIIKTPRTVTRKQLGSIPALCALFLLAKPAYAYVDPGSGAMLWQVAVAETRANRRELCEQAL